MIINLGYHQKTSPRVLCLERRRKKVIIVKQKERNIKKIKSNCILLGITRSLAQQALLHYIHIYMYVYKYIYTYQKLILL